MLHVLEAFAGGTERHLIDLIRHADGIDHVIAVPRRHHGRSTARAAAAAASAGARVVHVEMGRSRAPHRHAAALSALRRLIVRTGADVVHGHSSIGGALARMAVVGRRVPVVYTPHGLSRSRWALAVERALQDRTDRMVAVSESERRFALSQGLVSPDRVVVIRNGVDPVPPPPLLQPMRAMLGLADDVPLVGCVGRLTWQKAPEIFVEACASVSRAIPEAHFVLIGAGILRPVVERAVTETGIRERFHLLPSLPNAAAALAELDVYALPSRFEGGPYTPLEAMRAGTPVVVTNVAGNRDLVEHELNGLVVSPEQPELLAEAITRLLDDGELNAALVRNGRRTVAEHDVRAMAAATESVYRELCGSDQPRVELRVRGGAALP